jgi:hypothetical protein
VVGLDRGPRMLEFARELAARRDFGGGVHRGGRHRDWA